MEAFVPPVVGGDVEARDGSGAIDELRDFFFEGEARDEIVDASLDGERGIAEGQGGGSLDLLIGGRRCRGGRRLRGCGERKQKGESEYGWMRAHECDSPQSHSKRLGRRGPIQHRGGKQDAPESELNLLQGIMLMR